MPAPDASRDASHDAIFPPIIVVPPDAFVALDAACATGERLCGTTCALPTDPAFGCGSATCTPC